MKQKRGFTLVEMLIVIVIIGILAAAILPRIMGVYSKARDTKRVADFKKIQMAIEMYRNDHGTLSGIVITNNADNKSDRETTNNVFNVSELKLGSYLENIPKDHWRGNTASSLHNNTPTLLSLNPTLKKGEYLYRRQFNSSGIENDAAVLVVKVENPGYANYIFKLQGEYEFGPGGGLWYGLKYRYDNRKLSIDNIYLCSEITKKVKEYDNVIIATKDNKKCTYSDEDQLYYIVKIK